MKGIIKQYIFLCSRGREYGHIVGNCQYCAVASTGIIAETEEEAIEKFKKCGGKITDDGRIIMPETFCELMQD